jgi:outer membrane protein assembly factor BamB
MNGARTGRKALRGAAVAAALAAFGAAQEELQENTAHLRAYPELEQLVSRASALAAAGRYAEALAIYEEAAEKGAGAVVPLDRARAWGVREYVRARIAEWPEEGRAAYRKRADPAAEHLFEVAKRSGDVEALERLAARYPFSSFAGPALVLAANLHFDAGRAERAAALLARLPAGEAAAAPARARLGLAWAHAGNRAALEELAGRVAREAPRAEVRVGGRPVRLAEFLAGLAARASERSRSRGAVREPAGWEMVSGAPSGTRLAEPLADLPRPAWAEPLSLPRFLAEEFHRGAGLALTPDFRPFFPVVSDGVLFLHNGSAVVAYNLFARRPEILWQYRVAPPGGEVMFDNRVIYAATVHDGRVFANLVTWAGGAEVQLGYVTVKFPFPRRALFALDAATGRPVWKLGGRPRGEALEEIATFSVPPVPDGDRLYVGAIRQVHSTDPFEHYVLCLDAATGRVVWSTFVASGGTEINLFGNSTRESLGSPVCVTEDSVFYSTNHGVLAALDKADGSLRWAFRYRQLPVRPTRSVYVRKNELGWVNGPPVAHRGIVAAAPTDSPYLYALDARTGEPRWERPRDRELRSIWGAREGVLVVGGRGLELLDLRTGEPVAPPIAGEDLRGTGRGVLAEDAIWVPAEDKLRRVRWDGTCDEERSFAWPVGPGEEFSGGNLIVADGAVILAGQDVLRVYHDPRDHERLLREAMEGDTQDPGVLYRGAIRFLQAGRASEAIELLERAVERTARPAGPEEERLGRAARRRLFAVSLQAGLGELGTPGRAERAAEHFRRARGAAPDPASEAQAGILLAGAWKAAGRPARALEEYQELLARHGETVVDGTPVFEAVRGAVENLLAAAGREIYAPCEEEARKRLEAARKEGTAEAFDRVFRRYPNSRAAEEALLAAAEAQARLGRPEEEIAALRRFLREYPSSTLAPEACARLVRAFEGRGRFAAAAGILRRMAREFPEAPVADGGTTLTVAEFVERRRRAPGYARAEGRGGPPALAPPLRKVFAHADEGGREAEPLRALGSPPAAAAGLVFANYGLGIKAFDPDRGGPVWQVALDEGLRMAAFVDESLILATETSVTRVAVATGAVEWTYRAPARMRGFGLGGALLFFHTTDPEDGSVSRVGALDLERGNPAWAQSFNGLPASAVWPAGEAVAFTSVSPAGIHVFEAETGRRWAVGAPVVPRLAADVLHASEGLFVLHAERRAIEGYDLPSARLRWKVNLATDLPAQAVEAGEGILALAGPSREGGSFVALVDPRTGKLLRLREGLAAGDVRLLAVGPEEVWVVSREEDREISVRALRREDLSTSWTARLGGREATLLPPMRTREHLVVATFSSDAGGKYGYAATLLDRSGRAVQNIQSAFVFDRPPACGAAAGGLMFTADARIEFYR